MKRSVAILLLPMLISSWVGMAMWSQDPSGNGRTDLEDAIVFVKGFARTAEDLAAFSSSVEKVVTALRAVAGLKTVIKPVNDTQSASTSSSLDLPYLICSYVFSDSPRISSETSEIVFYCTSVEPEPIVPPPQFALC